MTQVELDPKFESMICIGLKTKVINGKMNSSSFVFYFDQVLINKKKKKKGFLNKNKASISIIFTFKANRLCSIMINKKLFTSWNFSIRLL